MNKASKWAFKAADLIARQTMLNDEWDQKPRFRVGKNREHVVGEITAEGRLHVPGLATLTPREAREYARWILDTFGEPEAEK